jgi:LCP family protein required for cell wall assembly
VLAGLLITAAAVIALALDPMALVRGLIADPNRFVQVAAALATLTLLWALIIVGTHVALRRTADLSRPQRMLGGTLVVALIAVIAVPATIVANDALVARGILTSVFGNTNTWIHRAHSPQNDAANPWADIPRVNVLLMGGDAGADRTGVRPDTLIVASINTRTGDTLLVSLPRNLQHVPFPAGSPAEAAYPNGFYCIDPATGDNTECLLNALWTWGDAHPQYYPGDQHPGLTATLQGVEKVTGLTLDDYVMLNLAGFEQLVDILGGLTVNVAERLPVGGSVEHPVASRWLEPGRQDLSGYLALWYARSRWSTTDYDRMRRQRCVIADFVDQVDPVTVALRLNQVAVALQRNLQTSIPLSDLNAWVALAQRVKSSHLRSLTFTDQIINTGRPDVPRMQELVQQALTPPATSPGASATSSPTAAAGMSSGSPSPGTGGSPSPATSPGQAQDVKQVC